MRNSKTQPLNQTASKVQRAYIEDLKAQVIKEGMTELETVIQREETTLKQLEHKNK